MELIVFGVIILIIAVIIVVGIALMSGSSRFRRHGSDRQAYHRPPFGSSSSR
jgi:hypothetical protein